MKVLYRVKNFNFFFASNVLKSAKTSKKIDLSKKKFRVCVCVCMCVCVCVCVCVYAITIERVNVSFSNLVHALNSTIERCGLHLSKIAQEGGGKEGEVNNYFSDFISLF